MIKKAMFLFIKIGFKNVTQNSFLKCYWKYSHKRYLKLVSQTLLEISVTSVTQNWFHKRYSKSVPQTLLKICFTNVT